MSSLPLPPAAPASTFPRWLPLLLGFLTAIGPLSTDMYLPAFPAVEASFRSPPGSAEITLAAWFMGLAVGQLVQGSLADRYGRRGPLLVGLVVFIIGSAGCALATDIQTLAICRFIAAFGGSASTVLPRAVVRDIAEGFTAAKLMSRLTLVMGAAPILAPSLGGLMLQFGSWRQIFWFGVCYALLSMFLVWRLLPETLPAERRLRLSFMAQLLRYAQILKERSFQAHAALGCSTMFLLFAYIGGSPAVFVGIFGLTPGAFAILFGANAAAFILASQLNPPLLMRFGATRVVRGVSLVMLAATLVLVAVVLSGSPTMLAVLLPITIANACTAIILPNATVGALARHSAHAGSASALQGTLQFSVAGTSGILLSVMADGTARPLAFLMLGAAIATVIAELMRPRS
ncbi:multidrug effflux MFS transporter [Roseomonas marmotae]|uniref:Bcr/CflA family efflux transporter n=1 Tax=Roseomonas marmotae TaxID=2768161 RepID=A0ABS3K7H7_9PROT|nr:multidrug effflux MFS transporter [Roseomonas marmotae]MBO1073403.1 multidrug effflux MFS transporter [Roseomonas marmotae]QTI80399.1 multidrug effflux MFS transporter [Roseomonas marmotae]